MVVLVCHHFNFLAGKWRHKMDLKFSIFIFVHLFCSDERSPLSNIKPKKLSKYLISIKRYNCKNVNICYKTKIEKISLYYISRLNQDIEELFSVLSLFKDRLSATDMKSLTIYILKFHFKSITSFSRQKYKKQKI